MSSVLPPLVTALCWIGAGEAPPPQAAAPVETLRWVETVAPAAAVRVVNPHGNVYARSGGATDRVEVTAAVQNLGEPSRRLVVRVTRTSAGDVDVVVEPESEPEEPGGEEVLAHGPRDRIDLGVLVPRGAALDVRTGDGVIEAKGLGGAVSASSVRGAIRVVAIEGRVGVESGSGDVTGVFGSRVSSMPQWISTKTGDVEVSVQETAGVEIQIATFGDISSEFPPHTESEAEPTPASKTHARVLAGGGGSTLTVTSDGGDVKVRRVPSLR